MAKSKCRTQICSQDGGSHTIKKKWTRVKRCLRFPIFIRGFYFSKGLFGALFFVPLVCTFGGCAISRPIIGPSAGSPRIKGTSQWLYYFKKKCGEPTFPLVIVARLCRLFYSLLAVRYGSVSHLCSSVSFYR